MSETARVDELDRLNLELYRACRTASSLLSSMRSTPHVHFVNADSIEQAYETLRVAMAKAERFADRKKAGGLV